MDDGLRRTAVHESGHAAASFLLGFAGAGPVSIAPGRAYSGICFTGHPERIGPEDLNGMDRPGPLLPARLRRSVETRVMVAMAGDVAAGLFWWAGRTGRRPEGAGEAVAGRLEGPPLLPPRESRLLGEWAAAEGIESDAEAAARLLAALHGDDLAVAAAHGRYLEAETRRLLGAGPGIGMVRALSLALLEHRILPVARWRAIAAAAA